ncbi:MAG TPA: STAS domain-containing protein [Candidatus Kapabacteria bacterium]|nr:STAS domain-containing protein [Candidatus Kapabacteria bacterium]
MNFTIEQKEHAAIFRPQETRLDSVVAPDLKAEFLILAQPDVATLVIDLSDVTYVDSAGLSALLLARRQQSSHEGDVRLVNVSDDVRSLLELTQLNRVFPIYETVQQALEAPQLSAIIVPQEGFDPSASPQIAGEKVAVAGAGVAALGAIALGSEGDLEEEDDEEYEDDYDSDDDDEEYSDEDEDDDEDEEGDEDDDEEDDGDEKEADDKEDTEDDFEYEEDIEFDDEDEDEEDDEF